MPELQAAISPLRCVAQATIRGHVAAMLGRVIGENIKAARKARGLSLEKLAERIEPKTSYQQLSRIEKGTRTLSVDWVERIAKALRVDPIELIKPDQPKPIDPRLDEQVANELGRTLAQLALQGAEPDEGIVEVLALALQELTATFLTHPQAYRDPEVARPVLDLVGRRYAPSAH